MVKMVRNGKIVYVRILFASIQCWSNVIARV
jgi:hypothetical protein